MNENHQQDTMATKIQRFNLPIQCINNFTQKTNKKADLSLLTFSEG